ncbi:MAG: hypothetical protein HZC28_06270 [Spirochaetes bacterium]|nr:hypothetical protein [Spirochaetota bacterium]
MDLTKKQRGVVTIMGYVKNTYAGWIVEGDRDRPALQNALVRDYRTLKEHS